MPTKAFIFDLDGVIIDSENAWDKLYSQTPGQSLGQSIKSSYQNAKKSHPQLSWTTYFSTLNSQAKIIYNQAALTPGINQLLKKLVKDNYQLAVVSGSTEKWIKYVLKRLNYPIKMIISLHDHPRLKPKPAPDGYLAAIKQLQVKPENTLILEDSNTGVQSAKAAGAYVICLTQHWPKNYSAPGADKYIKNLTEIKL